VLPSGERAKNARSISLPSLLQYYLVAMATSLDKFENKVQIHYRHIKRFLTVKRLRKLVQYIRRYSTKYAEPRREHTTQFPLGCFPPRPIFTKILHDIVELGMLFNHAYTRRYPIPSLEISILCTQNAFILWKDCKNWSSTSGDVWQNTPNPTWTRNAISSVILFSAKTAGPIFTKILHNIVALAALSNHAYTRR